MVCGRNGLFMWPGRPVLCGWNGLFYVIRKACSMWSGRPVLCGWNGLFYVARKACFMWSGRPVLCGQEGLFFCIVTCFLDGLVCLAAGACQKLALKSSQSLRVLKHLISLLYILLVPETSWTINSSILNISTDFPRFFYKMPVIIKFTPYRGGV